MSDGVETSYKRAREESGRDSTEQPLACEAVLQTSISSNVHPEGVTGCTKVQNTSEDSSLRSGERHLSNALRSDKDLSGLEMPGSFTDLLGKGARVVPDEAKDIEDSMNNVYEQFVDLTDVDQRRFFDLVKLLANLAASATSAAELQKQINRRGSSIAGGPKKRHLLSAYRELVRTGQLEAVPLLDELLLKKKGKSHSGVLVVTVLMGPGEFSCPKDCHYCPNQPGVARSYLLKEPAVMRGFRNQWDPIKQFYSRAGALESLGHVVDKIELIILGGTFSFYPKKYCEDFICASFYAANTYFSTHPLRSMLSIEEEMRLNEAAQCRIIGVTAETRPDYITNLELRRFRQLGVTRVQLGIQHLDDDVLDYINRDCPTAKAAAAIQRLLDAGFKVDAHWMPDLPGSSYEKDREMFENLLGEDNELFQVDQWKVYPTATVPFTKIKEWYEQGKYKPYAELEGGKYMVDLLVYIMANVPYRIRLNRIVRDIPNTYIIGGEARTNMRQIITEKMKNENIVCKDIRERECKGLPIRKEDAKVFIDEFIASGGTELYISVENKVRTQLYGHLRLRLRRDHGETGEQLFPALKGAALVRELHTYGRLIAVHHENTGRETQHVGVGTQLMRRAEQIALERGFKRVAVIAGVGVRLYYARLGYEFKDTYMVKELVADGVPAATTRAIIPVDMEDVDEDNVIAALGENSTGPGGIGGLLSSLARSFFSKR